jgi:protein Mpv17
MSVENHVEGRGVGVNEFPAPTKMLSTSKLWGIYGKRLRGQGFIPIGTKAASSMLAFALGDLLAQCLFSFGTNFNVMRFLRMIVFGGVVHAPSGHMFYRFLERKIPGIDKDALRKKVAIDQLLWSPLFAVITFTFMGLISGYPTKSIVALLSEKTWNNSVLEYCICSWLVWPMAHLVNFTRVKPSQRLLYVNSVQVFFNILVSSLVFSFMGRIVI